MKFFALIFILLINSCAGADIEITQEHKGTLPMSFPVNGREEIRSQGFTISDIKTLSLEKTSPTNLTFYISAPGLPKQLLTNEVDLKLYFQQNTMFISAESTEFPQNIPVKATVVFDVKTNWGSLSPSGNS